MLHSHRTQFAHQIHICHLSFDEHQIYCSTPVLDALTPRQQSNSHHFSGLHLLPRHWKHWWFWANCLGLCFEEPYRGAVKHVTVSWLNFTIYRRNCARMWRFKCYICLSVAQFEEFLSYIKRRKTKIKLAWRPGPMELERLRLLLVAALHLPGCQPSVGQHRENRRTLGGSVRYALYRAAG